MKKITIAFFALITSMISAQDGVSDATFGTNGSVLINNTDVSFHNKLRTDGSILYRNTNIIRHLTSNGMADTNFGIGGDITMTQTGIQYGLVDIESQNKIMSFTKHPQFEIYYFGRYNVDGTPDTTMGTNGLGYLQMDMGDIEEGIRPVLSQDGSFLFIAGNSDTAYGSEDNILLQKYSFDGAFDPSWNYSLSSYGINVDSDNGNYADDFDNDVDYLANGNVVITSYSHFSESNLHDHKAGIVVAKQPTTSGAFTAMSPYTNFYRDVKAQSSVGPGDKIYLLSGSDYDTFPATSSPINSVTRYMANANFDLTFAPSNATIYITLDLGGKKASFHKIAVQPDGKIILAGMTCTNGVANTYPELILARYLSTGVLDTTFGTDGYILHDIDHPTTAANNNVLTDLIVSPDFSTIYITGKNLENSIILKYSNNSMLPAVTPTFTQVAAICSGETLVALPTTSVNGILGTWSPAINNTATTTYTFTPVSGSSATTATMTITVNQPTSETITQTACSSFSLNGTTYSASGTYMQTSTNAAGCVHTTTLNLTINQPTSETITQTACSSFSLNGTTYSASGIYVQTSTNPAGCVHTTTLNLTITQPTSETISQTACSNYTLNGTTYNASGTYVQTSTTAAGCVHTTTLNLTINQPTSETLTETACSSYTLNGTTYNASGIYVQTSTNTAGCDHTTTLNLTINQPTSETISESACGSYDWFGTIYSQSGTYTHTSTNNAGCVHTTTLNLTITQPTSETITETACSSYSLNGTTYNASGTYVQTSTNPAGCVHTTTLNLTITQPTSQTITETACSNYTLNGTTYSASGIYVQTSTNPAGCVHTTTLNLTITQPTSETITETACSNYTLNGTTYSASGIYVQTSTNSAGCVHTTTLNLTINQPTTSTQTETVCDSFDWNGTNYSQSGTYTFTSSSASGCENTATLILIVQPAETPVGSAEQTFVEGATVGDIAINPVDVIWYGSLEDAQGAINPISTATLLENGDVYYAVNITDSGCTSEIFSVTTWVTLGTDSFSNVTVKVYPNPTESIFNIKSSTEIDSVIIYNLLGQQVLSKTIGSTDGIIDASTLPASTYMMKVTSGDTSKIIKIVRK